MARKPSPGALNDQQEMFCLEYIKDQNATQAATRAGYSAKTAGSQGARLLRDARIASRVQELLGERRERVKVEGDDVLREMLILLKSSVGDYVVTPEGRVEVSADSKPEAIRAVSGVKRRVKRFIEGQGLKAAPVEVEEVEFRLWDKVGIINQAMKHLGLFAPETRLKLDLGECSEEQLQRLAAGEDPVQVMMSQSEAAKP